ncbi:cell division protein FtsK [Microbacterium sp. CH12i]|uniref:FtsK/SpoIIIE domain-containing protein n=1 Tax=Microbacterium sp. CH12i TaxID=1479651 RepID=UPI0004617CBB|nr:FtsK/SpoIIIE domain-containing protein [Microbacterium sp. CH12i]KDA04834.1 cell division protein FtsK [Microbacterium sp. CH12i]
MDLEPLTLPATPAAPRRQPVPVLAAVVPIAAGVVLWLVTGSIFSLCFAALGPLMIGASLLDGLRTRRRERRVAAEEETAGWRRAEQDLRRRHQRERRELRRVHPDAAACVQDPPLRDLQALDEATPIVIGSGARRSVLRVTGDDSERSRAFRERASDVHDVPIVVPMGRGVCLRGPAPVAAAAARALIVQLCLRHAPAQLALVGDGLAPLGLDSFPHAGRPRRGAWRLAVNLADGDCTDAAAEVRVCGPGGEVPEGVTTVVDCADPGHTSVRTTAGVEDIVVECLSRPQAVAIAAGSMEREGEVAQLPDSVALEELTQGDDSGSARLRAAIGRTESAEVVLDLVEDGPHAIVTGMTGSGKSELLVTWVTSMARTHSPEEVTFVLADFKGGTAFDPLRSLPHVAAVITDLDDEGARRGVQSLTAELRRRETVLQELGVRNVAESKGQLARLVIVVDEFAALLQEHPDLGAVFTDVAARGRALGMHLILGTQRAAGVIRDALAANCPLRVSLRVTEAADSRLVIGSDEAAELPGGAGSRGLAFVRRPQDSSPAAVRVALTGAGDLRSIGARFSDAPVPTSPWLPPLPRRLALAALAHAHPAGESLLLGLADEPEKQRQIPVLLRPGVDRGIVVIGGSGSGRTTVLRALSAQNQRAVFIDSDPERAWDTVADLSEGDLPAPDLVLCDDLDQLTAAFPIEHAQVFLERFEKLVRTAAVRGCTIVVTTSRVSGQISRVIEALPTRMLLRMGTKLEHLAAGGENDGYRRDRPAGRARMDNREVQIVWAEPDVSGEQDARIPTARATSGGEGARATSWAAAARVVGVVAPGARRVVEALRAAHPNCEVKPVSDRSQDAPSELGGGRQTILVGDPETWQRHWGLWQQIRLEGEMLILAECAAELRAFTGSRTLPPYAEPHVGRAWSIQDGRQPRRVIIPELDPSNR